MTENEFDNPTDRMMREALEQKTFAMKDAYWLDARRMIDADRKKRRGFFLLFTGLLLLGVTGISVAYRYAAHVPQMAITQPATSGNTRNNTPQPHTSAPANARISTTPATSIPKQQASAPEHLNTAPAKQTPTHKHPNTSHVNTQTLTHPNTSSGNTITTRGHIHTPKQQAAALTYINIPNANTPPTKSTPKYPNTEDINTASSEPTISAPTHINTSHTNTEPEEQSLSFTQTTAELTLPDLAATGPIASGYQPALIPFAWCDSCTRTVFCAPDSNTKPRDIFESSYLSAQAGLTYYNTAGAGLNANTSLGLQYHYLLHPGLYLVSGLYYNQLQQQLGDLHYEKVTYGFGREVDRTTIQTSRLDYVQVPVQAACRLFSNNFISAGFTYGYLLQSANRVTRQASEESAPVSYRTHGYTYAINRNDVQLHIGYTLLLPRKLQVSCVYGYGISDVTKNNVFRSAIFDRNRGFRFNIGYKFLQK